MHFLSRRSLLQSFATAAMLPLHGGSADDTYEVEISTPLGRLRGVEQDGVRVFLGVPFAQPPVGKLRFRPPLPCPPWTGARRSFVSPAPVQSGLEEVSEDCLYLNLFTPIAPGPHPVFVYIYGGGNIAGWANNVGNNGSKFARDGVVSVVLNYRVGALGFLELRGVLGEAYSSSGNNAIADQVAALRWVKANISAFGGDPARVTVGGESAGAKNVAALMACNQSEGLFQQAIMESGSAQTVHSLSQAQEVTRLFLSESHLEPVQLLTLPTVDLLAAQKKLSLAFTANYPFRPVVDGDFLPDIPLHSLAADSLPEIHLLIGTNRDESSLFVDAQHAMEPLSQKELGNERLAQMAKLESAYKLAFPSLNVADLHIRMLTAEEYWIPSVRIAEARAYQKARTFMYRFDHAPATGPLASRAAHASELPFVWDRVTPANQMLATTIHAAWVAFIKNGHPAADGLPEWPEFRLPQRETMILNDTSKVESDPNGLERRLWIHRLD